MFALYICFLPSQLFLVCLVHPLQLQPASKKGEEEETACSCMSASRPKDMYYFEAWNDICFSEPILSLLVVWLSCSTVSAADTASAIPAVSSSAP